MNTTNLLLAYDLQMNLEASTTGRHVAGQLKGVDEWMGAAEAKQLGVLLAATVPRLEMGSSLRYDSGIRKFLDALRSVGLRELGPDELDHFEYLATRSRLADNIQNLRLSDNQGAIERLRKEVVAQNRISNAAARISELYIKLCSRYSLKTASAAPLHASAPRSARHGRGDSAWRRRTSPRSRIEGIPIRGSVGPRSRRL